MADIFVSYAREDKEYAQALAEVLIARGWTVWWDRNIPVGRSYSQTTEELERARCVLVLWSSHSVESEWVPNEAAEGYQRGILFPVLIDDSQIPFEFRRIQAATMPPWQPGTRSVELEDLVSALSALLGSPVEPPFPRNIPPQPTMAREEEAASQPLKSAPPEQRAGHGEEAAIALGESPLPLQTSRGRIFKYRKSSIAAVVVTVLAVLLPLLMKPTPVAVRVATPRSEQRQPGQVRSWALSQVPLKTLEAPDFKEAAVGGMTGAPPVTLKLHYARRNQITDSEAWYAEHGLGLSGLKLEAPEYAPKVFQGLNLIRAIPSGDRLLLIYGPDYASGRLLLAQRLDNKEFEYALDFSNYLYAPRNVEADKNYVEQQIGWAQQMGDVLYVSHGHNTYAKSSFGMNAYISAIEVNNAKPLWHSPPLVSNAEKFEVYEDYLITGYGFTDEPDFLYLLRRDNGKAVTKIAVRSGPECIIRSGNMVYVRTYNTDYAFKIVHRQ